MRFINKIFLASALIISATACKKELDLRPTDSFDVSRAFRTVADLEEGLFGVYSSYGGGQVNGIYIGSILSDETKISFENRGQGQFSYKWQYSASGGEHNSDYLTYYRAIDRANRVLAAMSDITAANPSEVAMKSRVEAELYAFRGMAHYELLRRFMPAGYDANALGVPIMLVSDITAAPARNTVGEVVAQIKSDLAAARGNSALPNSVSDRLRLSKAAVAAYQARVSLLERNWANAEQFATDAMTLSGTTLASRAVFPAIWQDASNTGVIFRIRNNYAIQLLWRDSNGDVFFEPSDKLKNQYNRTADVRFPTYFGSATTGGQNDTSIVTKYPGSALQGPQRNDIKDVRIAEMYLIRAEARAEQNNLSGAAEDLNAVRAARISGYTNVSFGTKAEAIDAIMNERFKELCFEGFRFFDLKRRNLAIQRNASDVTSNLWQTLAVGDYRFALPIPQDNIFANPNSQQNPGY